MIETIRTKMDRWFTVGTCCVEENGKMIKSIIDTNRLMHRERADITVYINEYTVTDRAKGEGTVVTIRRETV